MTLAEDPHATENTTEADAYAARAPTGVGHILVCLDRAPAPDVCLPHAVALAKVFDARLTLLHVMQPAHADAQTGLATPDPLGWEIARQEAQAYLDRMREQTARLGPVTDTLLAQGEPAARIVSAAAELGADLTVLGCRGNRAAGGCLGSTSQQVVALTRGSVFVARGAVASNLAASPRRILVPLDGSPRTECVLPAAVRIARAHHAEIILVHVVSEPVPSTILAAGEDLDLARELARRLEAGASRYLHTITSRLAREGIAARAIVLRQSDEREALVELNEREHADLTIMAAHGSTCNAARPFGNVSSHLLRYGRPALLLIQDIQPGERDSADDVGDDRCATPLRGTSPSGPAEGI